MRTRYTAAAVATLLAVPAVTRAQRAQDFVLRGCTTGITNYGTGFGTPGFRATVDTLACFVGTATLAAAQPVPGQTFGFYTFAGDLTTTYGPTFSGTRIAFDDRPLLTLTTAGGRSVYADVAGAYELPAGAPVALTALAPITAPFPDPSAFVGGTLSMAFVYHLPGEPPGYETAGGMLTITAAPEPAPLALTAVALGGVAGLAVRRRRRRRA